MNYPNRDNPNANNPNPFNIFFKLPENFYLSDPNDVTAFTYDYEKEEWNAKYIKSITLNQDVVEQRKYLSLSMLKTTPIILTLDNYIGESYGLPLQSFRLS